MNPPNPAPATSSRPAWPRSAGLALAVWLAALLLGPQPVVLPLVQAFRDAADAQARQDYPAAADALAAAAARLPYVGSVVYRAGLAEISAERYPAAIRHIQAAAALDGWTPARHIALGDAYLGQGDRDAALAQWEQALPGAPDDDALLARLANGYEAAGRYPEAIATLTTLAQVRGDDRAVFWRLAVLTAATTPAQALSRLALVGDIAPDLAPLTRQLMTAIEEGLAADNEAYLFARVGRAFIDLGEWGPARLALSRALLIVPEYPDALMFLGLAQDMLGEDGLASYEAAVRLAPDSPLAHFLLGLHWRRLGDSNSALPSLQTAQALDPQNPAIAAEIGGAFASLGDLTTAEIWLTQAVRLNDRDPKFWLLLAQFYVDHDYHVPELGLPAARQAATLAPDDPAALDTLGYALVLTGDLANGQKLLERALALAPQRASVHYHLGMLYARQDRMTEAQAALETALQLDGEGYYGALALAALARLTP